MCLSSAGCCSHEAAGSSSGPLSDPVQLPLYAVIAGSAGVILVLTCLCSCITFFICYHKRWSPAPLVEDATLGFMVSGQPLAPSAPWAAVAAEAGPALSTAPGPPLMLGPRPPAGTGGNTAQGESSQVCNLQWVAV